ncbi:MAG: DUF1015 domain-containing protein [Candidatus Omnitrophica bacterium]|nr:DUF1015 domain-containing protein [Candidatus Omnitrophota bacterium]
MIFPFRGFRFSEKAGKLEDLIAPPYDVIGKDYRKKLINRSSYNIVHLTLPESFDSEYHDEVKEKLDDWCNKKIFVQDESERYYVVVQKFSIEGKTFERYGFIGLFDLQQSGRIIRHEITFDRYIDDRVKLLKATKSNLEPIFLVFEDRENTLEKVAELTSCQRLDFEDYSIKFSAVAPENLSGLVEKIKKGNLFIADGHHRFQASLEFFKKTKDAPQYIMVYLTNLFSPGLVVLPTHRAIKVKLEQRHLEKVKQFFSVEEKDNLKQAIEFIKSTNNISFGVYFDSHFQTWTLTEEERIMTFMPGHYSRQWKSLDVAVLHHFIIEKVFGIPADEKLYYDRDPYKIVEYVNHNPGSIGFFMQTPDLMKIRQIAMNGEILPPKTTFFYPKVPSGLVIARYV